MKKHKSIIAIILVFILAVGGYQAVRLYNAVKVSNTAFEEDEKLFFVNSGSSFLDFTAKLKQENIIDDQSSFEYACTLKKYKKVKAGRYIVKKGSDNNSLINLFRSGNQSPVRLTFNNARTIEDLAGKVAPYLECDSVELLTHLKKKETAASYGFNRETFVSMFLPNTYEMWWNSNPAAFCDRMANEYRKFWNADRKSKAQNLGLSQSEVATLASIVKAESLKTDEARRIAGVYYNRLKKGMLLQADPTLVFAHQDFTITRVLDKHKEIDSPYNTYKYSGLPPGPINLPDPVYIDAALDPENHKYLYFCARPDFSGYHNFAKSYNQHLRYAREYQRALNQRRIYR